MFWVSVLPQQEPCIQCIVYGEHCFSSTPFNRVIQIAPELLRTWVRADSEVKNVRSLSIWVFHENTLLSNVHTFLSLFWESIHVHWETKWDWAMKINLWQCKCLQYDLVNNTKFSASVEEMLVKVCRSGKAKNSSNLFNRCTQCKPRAKLDPRQNATTAA